MKKFVIKSAFIFGVVSSISSISAGVSHADETAPLPTSCEDRQTLTSLAGTQIGQQQAGLIGDAITGLCDDGLDGLSLVSDYTPLLKSPMCCEAHS